MSVDTVEYMLSQPVSEWTFAFWKEQVEATPDIPGAVGRLSACTQMDCGYDCEDSENIRLYLLEIADKHLSLDDRSRALALKARKLLQIMISRRYGGLLTEYCEFLTTKELDKLLWFFRPFEFLKLANPCTGQDQELAYLRRVRKTLMWSLWQGHVREAKLDHKIKALELFYMTDQLHTLIPVGEHVAGASWWAFNDVVETIHDLANLDKECSNLPSLERTAIIEASPAALILIMLRTLGPEMERISANR